MALTNWLKDQQNSGATVAIPASTTTTMLTVTIPTDRTVYIKGKALFGLASSGHMGAGGALTADVAVKNNNGTVTILTAMTSSFNPATNANLIATAANAVDAGILNSSTMTLTWVINGTTMQLQVTTGTTVACDGFAFAELFEVGYA